MNHLYPFKNSAAKKITFIHLIPTVITVTPLLSHASVKNTQHRGAVASTLGQILKKLIHMSNSSTQASLDVCRMKLTDGSHIVKT